LINGVCQGPTANCTNYDNNNFVCLACSPGFNLTALGICVLVRIPDPNCIAYDPQSGLCVRCLPNFNYNAQAQQCESSFCAQFNNNQQIQGRTCLSCLPGFSIFPRGAQSRQSSLCVSIYCQTYTSSTGICSECIPGTALNGSICYALNCITYSNQYSLSPVCLTCA
jgi:hypothetical protein